jgi:hypothetical protein
VGEAHCKTSGSGQAIVSAVESTVAIVWLQVLVFPHGSAADHVRVTKTLCPPTEFVTVFNTEMVTVPQLSEAIGGSKTKLPIPHRLVLFPTQVMTGAIVSLTVIVCVQVALLWHVSLAV